MDPRRPQKIARYKPLPAGTPADDPTPDYMNLLGMIFSMCGLMMKLKWCAWVAVYCSFMSFANSRTSDDTKQMLSSFMLSICRSDVLLAEPSAHAAPVVVWYQQCVCVCV